MNIKRVSLAEVFNLTSQVDQSEDEACDPKRESGGAMAIVLAAAAAAVMAVVAGAPGIAGAILAVSDSSAIAKDLSLGCQDLQGPVKLADLKLQ